MHPLSMLPTLLLPIAFADICPQCRHDDTRVKKVGREFALYRKAATLLCMLHDVPADPYASQEAAHRPTSSANDDVGAPEQATAVLHAFKFKKEKACAAAANACVQVLSRLAAAAVATGDVAVGSDSLLQGTLPNNAVLEWAGMDRRLNMHVAL